jgi:hypothetical protein
MRYGYRRITVLLRRDAHLAAHLGNLRSALRLLERKRNLLFSELRSLHRPASLSGSRRAGFSHSNRSNFPRGAQQARWQINSANIAPRRISMTLPKVKIIPTADGVIEQGWPTLHYTIRFPAHEPFIPSST